MGIVLSILFGFIPMLFFAWILYWMDRYEKEPVILLGGVFVWGAVVAAGGAFILNSLLGLGVYLFTRSEFATEITIGSLIAPIVEESLKCIAVLFVYIVFRKEFDSLLDGIVYAGIVALGFAATENFYYIYSYGFLESGIEGIFWMVFVRIVLVGWQHPFYTAFIGMGLAIARLNCNRLVKIATPLLSWGMAVSMHSIHNSLATLLIGKGGLAFSTLVDWTGWFFVFLVILFAIWREQRWIVNHLSDEVGSGIISAQQYRTACSAWAQSAARFFALWNGNYRVTNRFYQISAELAFKKQQYACLEMGEEYLSIIEQLRKELAELAPSALA
jgi:RsiW-degrading membrane proteinase PrsW (M82 family)